MTASEATSITKNRFLTADVEKMHVFKNRDQIDSVVGLNFGFLANSRGQRHVAGSHIYVSFVTEWFKRFYRGRDGFPRAMFGGLLEILRPNTHDHFCFGVTLKKRSIFRVTPNQK